MSKKSSIIIKEKKIGLTERANLISPDTILEQSKNRISELQALLIDKKAALQSAPEGSLRIAQSGKRIQYYHKTSEENPQGKYLPRNQDNLAAALAQKDYDQKLIKELEDEISTLEKLVKNYQPSQLVKIYEDMHTNRQNLVNPSAISDNAFEEAWSAYSYESKTIPEGTQVYTTQKGETVLSQSQALIADTLNQLEIPYRYGYPLMLNGSKGFSKLTLAYPTFYCLNVHNHKEIIWEHFENMEEESNVQTAITCINQYQEAGFFQGERLITTFETSALPLTAATITLIAQKYLK